MLWRQGDDGARDGLHRRGRASRLRCTSRAIATVEIGRAGPGRDGRRDRAARRRRAHDERAATETATVLALGRPDFAALLARRHPAAFALKRRLASLLTARLRNQLAHLRSRSAARRRRRRPSDAARALAELEYCGAARQQVRASHGDLPRLRAGRALGLPDVRELCAVRAGPHAARRRGAVDRLLPDDQGRGREGADSRRPAHSRRACRAGEGVRLREPHRRQPVSRHRHHARAGAPARPAARPVRAAVQRRGRRLPRLPRRDPAGDRRNVRRRSRARALASARRALRREVCRPGRWAGP